MRRRSMMEGPVSFPSRRGGRKSLRLIFRLILGCIVLGLLWTAFVQYRIHSFPSADGQKHVDVGIVLGASVWNNEPSPGLRERLERALKLYRNGQVDRLIVTGGLDHNGSTITEAEGMRNYLVRQGVPDEAIIMEKQATSTYENVLFSKRIMAENGWKSSILITHQYHAARAYDIARFLELSDPKVSATDSQVLWMPYHKARETLAYTKWELDRLRYTLVGKAS